MDTVILLDLMSCSIADIDALSRPRRMESKYYKSSMWMIIGEINWVTRNLVFDDRDVGSSLPTLVFL